jgi:hypothetical protein
VKVGNNLAKAGDIDVIWPKSLDKGEFSLSNILSHCCPFIGIQLVNSGDMTRVKQKYAVTSVRLIFF